MKKLILILIFISIGTSLLSAQRDCLKQAELDELGRSSRPDKDTYAISPSGHFYIHYDLTGNAAPNLTDNDTNGVPDYVDEVGIIADSARHVLVDMMGWEEEPFDGEGGYDIYIMSYASGVYGYNYKDIGNTSYLQIDNDYMGYNSKFDLAPIDIMRITVGHEYFHGIQWGYEENLGSNAYFYEMTSMWFEDVLIPDGNDYLDGWADDLLDNPTAGFDNTGSGYELALFGHYLSSFIDPSGQFDARQSTIMKKIWERFRDSNSSAYTSVKYILENNFNWDFSEAWIDFISRNLYNGMYESMDNPYYYYIDQSIVDPINTNTTLLTYSSEFELNLDNKSAAIESFQIGSLESIFTIEHDSTSVEYIGRVAIISSNEPELNNLFWGSDTTIEESYSDVEVHFIYGVEGSSITLPIEITAHTVPLPPSNLYVTDIPNDQGGYMYLSFNKCGFDTDTLLTEIFEFNEESDWYNSGVEFYTIQRKDGELWISLQSIAAYGSEIYTTEVRTISDSTSIDNALTEIRVIAAMIEGNFVSDTTVTGYSVDNITPATPLSLSGVYNESENRAILSWDSSQANDISHYNIYKNTEFYSIATETSFIDEITTDTEYSLSSVDIHENESGISESVLVSVSLNVIDNLMPTEYALMSAYPNPFNPVTNITYGLPEHVNVQIVVYDLSGKQVETLINEFQTPGYYSVNWDADNLPSGVYLIRMDSGDYTQTQKVVLVK